MWKVKKTKKAELDDLRYSRTTPENDDDDEEQAEPSIEVNLQSFHRQQCDADAAIIAAASSPSRKAALRVFIFRTWGGTLVLVLTGAAILMVVVVVAVAFAQERSESSSSSSTSRSHDIQKGDLFPSEQEAATRSLEPAPASAMAPSSTPTTSPSLDLTATPLSFSLHETYNAHSQGVYNVAFTLDGTRLVSCGCDESFDKLVGIWDVANRKEQQQQQEPVATIDGHKYCVTDARLDPTNQWLGTTSFDETVQVWNVSSSSSSNSHNERFRNARRIRNYQGFFSEAPTAVAWRPFPKDQSNDTDNHNGATTQVLAVASDDYTIRVWEIKDTNDKDTNLLLQGHASFVNDIAFSPDASLLASASHDATIRLWDASSPDLEKRWTTIATLRRGLEKPVWTVAFRPVSNGASLPLLLLLASGSEDGFLSIWDVSSTTAPQLMRQWRGHHDTVYQVVWSPDGRYLASASADQTVCIWNSKRLLQSPLQEEQRGGEDDERDYDPASLLQVLQGHKDLVRSVDWSPDGLYIASGSNDRRVKIWRRDDPKFL